jgi:hypothetical protein
LSYLIFKEEEEGWKMQESSFVPAIKDGHEDYKGITTFCLLQY